MKHQIKDMAINLFLDTKSDDFVKNFSLTEFTQTINQLPTTIFFYEMSKGLIEDFCKTQNYEYCTILQTFINRCERKMQKELQ